MSTRTFTVNLSNTEPIDNAELAAFIVMLFRVHKDPLPGSTGHDPTKPEDRFADQLKSVGERVPPGPSFRALRERIEGLKKLHNDTALRLKIEAAHHALFELFVEVHETGDWGGCKTVDMEQILQIAALGRPPVLESFIAAKAAAETAKPAPKAGEREKPKS